MMHSLLVSIVMAVPAASHASNVAAREHEVPRAISLHGVIREVAGVDSPPVRVGDLVILDATLAPHTPDRDPDPSIGEFPGHLRDLSLAFDRTGPTHLTGDGDLRVRALERTIHGFVLSAGRELVHVEVELADPSATSLASDGTGGLWQAGDLPERSLLIEMDRGSGYWFARAEIREVSIRAGCSCDTDDSGGVDTADLLLFIERWILDDPDAERDGLVGVTAADLLLFLDCWFQASDAGHCT